MVKCPTCGETKIKWSSKPWDASDKDFWKEPVMVTFLCYGKYEFTKSGCTEISPCQKGKQA
jgi:hypothetical protein